MKTFGVRRSAFGEASGSHHPCAVLTPLLVLGFSTFAQAQNWTVTYSVDDGAAAQALGGQHRVAPMHAAIDRVKTRLEHILAANAGSSLLSITFGNPTRPNAIAETQSSQFFAQPVSVARDKLINVATDNLEDEFEILLYEQLPPSSVPFRFDTNTVRSANFVSIPNALNKQLQFGLTTNQNDGTITIRPQAGTLLWQLWPAHAGQDVLAGYESFEATLTHETLHVLGYTSFGESTSVPTSLTTMDILRIASNSTPINAASFNSIARELRPTIEASLVTQLGTTSGIYPLSRGTRAGGDGFQTSHWISATRLNPPTSIGVMDPAPTLFALDLRSNLFLTRADAEGLDLIGWNIDPNVVPLGNAGQVNLIAPAQGAQIPTGQPITIEWSGDTGIAWVVQMYAGPDAGGNDPDNIFFGTDNLPPQQTSYQVPANVNFPPGTYSWYVVSYTQTGFLTSATRMFTVGTSCDPDVNQDGVSDSGDVDYLTNVIAGGENPNGTNPDFNNDGVADSGDVDALLNVIAGGACP